MRYTIRSIYSNEVELVPFFEQKSGETYLDFFDFHLAVQYMANFIEDHYAMHTLRSMLYYEMHDISLTSLSDQQVIEQIAGHLISQRILIREVDNRMPDWGVWQPIKSKEDQGPADDTEIVEETDWIEVQLVNVQDEPIKNVKIRITLAGGQVIEKMVQTQGIIELNDVDKGSCKIEVPKLDKYLGR